MVVDSAPRVAAAAAKVCVTPARMAPSLRRASNHWAMGSGHACAVDLVQR